jgi:hypothetical protein
MLKNRVDPLGNLIQTPARGAWMGNRGLIHNSQKEIVRPFRLKTWITCKLEFKGRKRPVMAPDKYTELFFLDEATAFAAGHRPCFECRREDADRFKFFWLKGNPEYHFDKKTPISKMDDILHGERINRNMAKISFEEKMDQIPDGSFLLLDDKAFLSFSKQLYLWSPFGYDQGVELPDADRVTVLTPKSIVNTFRAGYLPQMAVTGKPFR